MDASTITSTTFKLAEGSSSTAVSGLLAYAVVGNTLTFTPTEDLAASTTYTATITTGAKDLAGNALASDYVWTFTTGAATDTTSPELTLVYPASGATDVALNQAVTATFSEAMNPLTLTTSTFELTKSGSTVAATITYDAANLIATLTPTASLTANTTYTATVTSGTTDLAGNSLGSTGATNPWSFTTASATTTPPITLGSTVSLFGAFGGGAGITNQGINTVVTGDIGSTAASSLITGFHDSTVVTGGVYECTYTETTSNMGLVNGEIYTAPGTSQPTAACPDEGTTATNVIAETAASEAQTAYNTLTAITGGVDVSTCTTCGTTGGDAGQLGNRTLYPGTYASSTGSYDITTGDLTLDAEGNADAYWVFQMSTSLTIGTSSEARSVILKNGALASHIFWQVGSAATINGIQGGGTVEGTIISYAGITVSTAGVTNLTTINGRLLALNASVTIVNTAINVP
jgi:hypothetical protein